MARKTLYKNDGLGVRGVILNCQSLKHSSALHILCVHALAVFFAFEAFGGEHSYYEAFTNAVAKRADSIWDTNLINTNNWEPSITNIAFVGFRQGQLAGLKLGMTMSEVVAVWGKPRMLSPRWIIGPRFGYGPGSPFGDVSLSFSGDKLILIAISGGTAQQLAFDNGLSGRVGKTDFEKALGEPSIRDRQDQRLYNGEIAYRAGPLRTDFSFEPDDVSPSNEHLRWAAVRIEAQARRYRPTPNNPIQPTPR